VASGKVAPARAKEVPPRSCKAGVVEGGEHVVLFEASRPFHRQRRLTAGRRADQLKAHSQSLRQHVDCGIRDGVPEVPLDDSTNCMAPNARFLS
jgi:hypothetical protein